LVIEHDRTLASQQSETAGCRSFSCGGALEGSIEALAEPNIHLTECWYACDGLP
jgi:hypothetical protein